MAGANFELRISEEALEASFAGDVRKLAGSADKYRLRVGNHRILFRLVGNQIQVYAVRDRKEAYD